MEMKWHPVVNGDLSEAPRDEDIIFTVFDKNTKEVYTARGIINDCMLGHGYVCVGLMDFPIEVANVKAWMELPPPFKPNDCNKCAYWNEWTDEFGDGSAECELHKNVPFTKIKFGKCPLEK